MMKIKTKALQIAANNLKGFNCAIAHTVTYKIIVSQSPEKGKAHDGMLQLQSTL
jgi:hypothetical protein